MSPSNLAALGKTAIDLREVAAKMVRAARARATASGVPFSISVEDILIPQVCPAIGIPILVGQNQASDNSPSLDRVIPLLGYVPGNVLVVSNRTNRIKNNASVAELRAIAAFYEKFITENWMKKT